MSVNTGLSAVSDHVLMVAVVIYSLALLAYAGDFAYGRRAQTATAAAKPVSELAGVGSRGAAPGATGDAAGGGAADVVSPGGLEKGRQPLGPLIRTAIGAHLPGRGHAPVRCDHPGHRGGPGAVGRHVRVRDHADLRRGAVLHRGHAPLPGLAPGPVRHRRGDGGAGPGSDHHLHPGRPAGAGAEVVLAGHPRGRDDALHRHLLRGRGTRRGSTCPPSATSVRWRRGASPRTTASSVGCPARRPWTG